MAFRLRKIVGSQVAPGLYYRVIIIIKIKCIIIVFFDVVTLRC